MLKQPTPEKAIDIIWLSVVLSFCWPLPSDSSKTRVLVYKTLQISSIVSACSVLLALTYAIYLHSDNILIVSQCICIFMGISQQVIQGTICVINHDSLQRVVEEMLNCVKEAQQYEKQIYCKLVAKCSIFFGSSIVCIYLTSTVFSVGPAFTSASFPCDAEYPFAVNDTPLHVIIYVQQSIVCYQCAAHLCLSMFGALLFWFTAARFECLAIEITQITNTSMLIVCIKKQLYLRSTLRCRSKHVWSYFMWHYLTHGYSTNCENAICNSIFHCTRRNLYICMASRLLERYEYTCLTKYI